MDRGVIAVSEKIKKNVKPREFENSTDSDFYKALDQGTITNNSIVSQRSLVSDEQSAVVFNDIKDQTQTAGPLEVGRGYGMQTGHFIRNAGATVLTELAQGSGVISALGSATETLTATHNTNQEVFQEQMGTLQDQNVEAKESLEESIVARNKQEAVVDSWKFFSFGSFSGKYWLTLALGFTVGLSLAFVFGKNARNFSGSGVSLSPPQLANQVRETIIETNRNFSFREGFTTTVKQTESLQQQWTVPFSKE